MSVIALLKKIKDQGIHLWVTQEGTLGFKAPKGAMTPALAVAVKANKPAIIGLLQGAETIEQLPTRAPRNEPPRLSSEQKRLYFIERLNPGTLNYHMPGGVTLNGPLQADALEQAFQHVIERHDVLRTCFLENNGEPYPVIVAHCQWHMDRIDASSKPEPEVQAMRDAFFTRPFDLGDAPLLRAAL